MSLINIYGIWGSQDQDSGQDLVSRSCTVFTGYTTFQPWKYFEFLKAEM